MIQIYSKFSIDVSLRFMRQPDQLFAKVQSHKCLQQGETLFTIIYLAASSCCYVEKGVF